MPSIPLYSQVTIQTASISSSVMPSNYLVADLTCTTNLTFAMQLYAQTVSTWNTDNMSIKSGLFTQIHLKSHF